MTGRTERVVLVKGDATKWYEQAIFIVNTNAPAESMPLDFVAEAEKIIGEYNLKRETVPPSVVVHPAKVRPFGKRVREPNFLVHGVIMALAAVVIAAVFAFGLLT